MWEIYAYQGADTLAGVFNAIAAIAGAQDFVGAIAVVAFCGFITAFVAYALAPQKLIGWQWLASSTLILSVLFVPRVQVGIIDKTGGGAERIVDNVPLGLASLASITSTIGNVTSSLFETAFQAIPGSAGLPPELAYQKNGLMFGNRMIRKASRVVFAEPRFRTDLINFIGNCTMYDLADGTVAPADFANSGNAWPLMATPNPARFSSITNASGETQIMPCPEVYKALDKAMPLEVKRIHDSLALEMNPALPPSVVSSVLAGQIEQTYIKAKIADAAASAADIVRQNALINAINDTSLLIGQKINDAPAMMLAVGRAQALAQTNAAWINSGKVAEQGLPVIRNVIEALAYALFPVWILLLLLTSGKETVMAIKNYSSVLIFLQLWPVLYAILNYLATIYAAKELGAAADVGGGLKALSLSTSNAIYSNAVSSEAVVGYLTASIPFIAWFAMKRMENFGMAVLSGWSTLQSTVTASTNATAIGNTGMGNVAMDQMTLTPTRSSPFFNARQNDQTGNFLTTQMNSGLTAIKAFANEGPVSRMVQVGVTNQHVIDAGRSVEAARNESAAAQSERASVIADLLTRAKSKGGGTQETDGSGTSHHASTGQRVGELMEVAENVAHQTGATVRQVTEVALGGSLKAGIGPTLKAPFGAQGTLDAMTGHSASLDALDQRVRSALSKTDTSKFREFSDAVTQDTRYASSLFSDSREANEFSRRLSSSTTRVNRAESNLHDQESYSERVASLFSRGETITIDLAKEPVNSNFFDEFLRQNDTGSARRMMESYLGSHALPPTQNEGTSRLPQSFYDVEARFAAKRDNLLAPSTPTSPSVNPGNLQHKGPTHGAGLEEHTKEMQRDLNKSGKDLRAKVDAKNRETYSRVMDEHGKFDASTGIERDAEGKPHPAKGKSLIGKVYSNMEQTRDPITDGIRDAARKLASKWSKR
jgi:conjugal transfer mating pair stabilization protein TraG